MDKNSTQVYQLSNRNNWKEQPVKDGMLFIPDISGYTDLVHSTDVTTGRRITYELLSTIVNHNNLAMDIAEIEGDAVLFYKYGTPPTTCSILKQYKTMLDAFHNKLEDLESRYNYDLDLSLKVIAHYGPMAEYRIGGFKKLYGEVVVEAHRLLKNSVPSNSYVLMTEELMGASFPINVNELPKSGIRSNKLCEVYGGLRNICFTYFDFEMEKKERLTA